MKRKQFLSLLLCLLVLTGLAACGGTAPAPSPEPAETEAPAPAETDTPAPSPAVADASQMTTVEEVVEEGMTPVGPENLLDGEYPVQVKCSSSMFRIESALLRVSNGKMEAELTMGGKSYLYVYPGTALEAATGEVSAYIPFAENAEGAHTFTIPVPALDAPVPCAAFSKNKQLWYDRSLLFRVDSLPTEAFRDGFFTTAGRLGLADGNYSVSVSLAGGSGKASVDSPAALTVKYGACTARIVFSSKNYDYVRIGDMVFLPVNSEGNSAFDLPVSFFDRPMPIVADTVAMSEPHEISYTLTFSANSIEAAA